MFDEEGFDALPNEDKADVVQLTQLLSRKSLTSRGVSGLLMASDTRTEKEVLVNISEDALNYWVGYINTLWE